MTGILSDNLTAFFSLHFHLNCCDNYHSDYTQLKLHVRRFVFVAKYPSQHWLKCFILVKMAFISKQRVGPYVLEKRLAPGGMGEIWTANHAAYQDFDVRLAIKLLRDEVSADDDLRQRFENEARIMLQPDFIHPNIVRAYDLIDHPVGLVMDLVVGKDLEQLIGGRPLEISRVLTIADEILSALQYAHDRQPSIIHRDVKPANILVDRKGSALLTDFGIALLKGESRLTQKGYTVGSVAYLSPEQIKDEELDYRTDIYSFGLVLYEMLVGRRYFNAAMATNERRWRIVKEPSQKNSQVPQEFDPIIAKCLEEYPKERYQSCDELRKELKTLGAAILHPSYARRSFRPRVLDRLPSGDIGHRISRRSKFYAAAALCVILLLAITIRYAPLWTPTPPPPKTDASSRISPALQEKIVLRMYGSTSIGDDLAPALAKAYLRKVLGATDVDCRPSKQHYKNDDVEMKHCWGKIPSQSADSVIEIYSVGSKIGFECLENGLCDVGMSSRAYDAVKDKQSYPNLENLDRESLQHVIGLDGIAVIVHPQNKVPTLSVQELRSIFCDAQPRITTWNQLGLSNIGPIHRVLRDKNSGTRTMFEDMVCGNGARLLPTEQPDKDELKSQPLVDRVVSLQEAVGIVSSTLTGTALRVPIGTNSKSARLPDNFFVATEDYPLTRRLYFYNRSLVSPEARRFITWAMSEEGQDAAKANHFVPLTAQAVAVTVPHGAPDGIRRLTLSFRFRSGQTNLELDPLAKDNIDRVRNYLTGNPTTELFVLGFTDNQRPPKGHSNYELSVSRAQTVAKEFVAKRLPEPKGILGFGEKYPALENDTLSHREENRRVEVWVRP